MPERPADERNQDFEEVNLGYTDEQAIAEADRCLQCEVPLCVKGCPVSVDIPGFIQSIKDRDIDSALGIINRTNLLPSVCGRVCPQEDQCEKSCILNKAGKQIAIGNLERYVGDTGTAYATATSMNDKSVGIVGSGPAALACAADCAKAGLKVTIYEALHETGGVLMYGIPSFRLPKSIVQKEISMLEKLGVEIRKNAVIGKLFTLKELENKHHAFFIANGAGLPRFLDIPGENMKDVLSANEFLVRANLMRAGRDGLTPIHAGKNAVIIGGGNVAMDAARVAKRLGADTTILYRRTKAEMPARDEEIKHAEEEGIHIKELMAPVAINGDGSPASIKAEQMELGEPDDSGRRRPVPTGKREDIKADFIVVAIGQGPNPILKESLAEVSIETNRWGYIEATETITSNPKFYAGGDIVGGSATVIKAMGDGRMAAAKIIGRLS